ncbi:MAG: DNA topoisomerase I [Actinobacteria bacterium]|nr:DNA topoisomerase I [Actinomycetota bacterium]
MKLIVTEKNQTARRIADILSGGKAKREGGPKSTLYTFNENGEDVKCIGMRGHILEVDFPEEYQKWRQVEVGELLDAKIVKIPIDKALVTTLKKVARKADSVVIATDYDREGELIGFDIMKLIKEVNPGVTFSRALFSALTETQIEEAFANTGCLQENLARAGETRQDIDLIWGAVLTRFISLATKRGGKKFLSAGRVQSPTLTLLVNREQEIKAFVPEDFWVVSAVCERDGDRFTARHKTERFTREEDARSAFDHIAEEGKVTSVKTRERKVKPPAPFNTTSFLAAASTLKITPAQAMRIAEGLYTKGIISYPRVDNTVYPESLDLREVLRSFSGADVVGSLAGELLKKKSLSPTRGKKRATDHPPIYPTRAATKGKLKGPEWRIYELVARRFMATLSEPALARSTVVDLDIGGEPFIARGDVILDEGFLRFYPYSRKKDDELPGLGEGDMVRVADREIEGKQTQPPARYTQSKLIMKMEELSLGTKSTRHNIIQGLADREYASGNPLKPSDTGIAVASTLERHATLVTTPEMTAQLEQDMDSIVEGRQSLEGVVDTSREILKGILETMEESKEEISREIREGMRGAVLGACPDCGKDMILRKASRSGNRFAGCSGFPDCKRTLQLPQRGEITALGESCPECGNPRIRLELEGGKRFEFCLNPECPTWPSVTGEAMAKILEELQGPTVLGACLDCGGKIRVRKGKKSGNRFAGCDGYPKCRVSYRLPQEGEIKQSGESCDECGAPIILLDQKGRKPRKMCINRECETNSE